MKLPYTFEGEAWVVLCPTRFYLSQRITKVELKPEYVRHHYYWVIQHEGATECVFYAWGTRIEALRHALNNIEIEARELRELIEDELDAAGTEGVQA